ncbi:MAG: 4-hydroxy-tetrahydrodipicolinate reductase [Candidatus Altiarchaeota archaeon]|nr:4-hydroxy-tetrahydrodipicolinate reductase [Candidatus Altiarchaeota archaeon]
MAIKVAFLGVGRMGQAAIRAVLESKDLQIVAAFDTANIGQYVGALGAGQETGIKIDDPSNLKEILDKTKTDVVVDFTTAKACVQNSKTVGELGIPMVVGTTGFTENQIQKLKYNLSNTGLVLSPNMSVGVNVFWQLVGEAASKLPDYDIEVIETHHRFKKDAPSGTAKKAVEVIKDAVGEIKPVNGRSGDSLRQKGDVGIHSIRAGDIVGEHTVMFSSIGERFEIKHIAHSRDSFASGIPQAIRFIKDQKGFFDMWDVLELR